MAVSLDYQVIDIHVHVTPLNMLNSATRAVLEASQPNLGMLVEVAEDPAKLVDYMDSQNIEWLGLINYICPDVIGYTEAVNTYSAEYAASYPNRLIPFGGVDPRLRSDMANHMDYLLGDLGLKAIKIHPPHQQFNVNDYLFRPELRQLTTVYEKCVSYGVPLMVHTGTSVFPGARNRFADPMPIDDVAVDFPELKIIDAHAGRPLFMDTSFFLLRRHPNVYCDISSTPPGSLLRYYPWLERVADKVLFGSDWPGPGIRDIGDNIQQFLALDLTPDVKRKILRENALKVFNLPQS